MDAFAVAFTLPRSAAGSASFHHDDRETASISPIAVKSTQSPTAFPAMTQIERTEIIQPRRQDFSTFARLGSMRSRLPPSVKAFMPAAFGGSKRTSERIAEAVGTGSEKDSDNEAEGDEAVSAQAETTKTASAAAVENRTPKKRVDNKSEENFDVKKPDKAPSAEKPPFDEQIPFNNRDSRSTIGTKSSIDLSSAASFDSTAPSTAPAQSTKAGKGTSEPRSTTHSASASLTTFGIQSQPFGTNDLFEAMQRLSAETLAAHQCLVNVSAVRADTLRTLQSNGSSTSLSSDPFHRHTFPSLPPNLSSYSSPQISVPYGSSNSDALSGFGLHHQASKSSMFGAQTPLSSSASMHGHQPSRRAPHFNFYLAGHYQHVMSARGHVLREHPFRARFALKVSRNDVIDAALTSSSAFGVVPLENLKADVKNSLEHISRSTSCQLSVVVTEHHGADLGHGLETERHAEIIIAGSLEGVEQAKVQTMVMLDEMSGLHCEPCEIDFKLHNIIGGRKRSVIQSIQEETSTNVFLPSTFPGVFSTISVPSIMSRQNTIFITGEPDQVQRARDLLFQVSMHKSKSIISRDIALLPRKIDWLLMERLEELRSIMLDNASFVSFPKLGSQASQLTIFGDSRISIERTIRSIMQLACQFFIASVWLMPISFDGVVSNISLNTAQVTPIVKHVSTHSGAEVAFKGDCFEMLGLESEVRSAISVLLDLDLLRTFNLEIRFQIELANEHREFISGKKNGKINKIIKQGVRIKFENFNDYNFLIDIASNDRVGAFQGLSLLLEELPAEMSFHIPENYHKRIIGVGGKNIQKTMKKFGVYVKFYSRQDLEIETYPFLDIEDNVIARTPAKNVENLEHLKSAITELVNPKDKDFVQETVPIARRYHRSLLGIKGPFIHDIESKLSCLIRFPPAESANDLVSIFGPESQIHVAGQMLLDHVPFEAEFRAPETVELSRLLASHDFTALTERLRRDLNINIIYVGGTKRAQTPNAPVSATQSPAIGVLPGNQSPPMNDIIFKFQLNRNGVDFLPAAKDALEEFLVSRNIEVYRPPEQRARADSFASSFHHFANKLISVPQASESTDSFQTDPVARYNRQQVQQQQQLASYESSRLRGAASTPDIKALFDSPSLASGPFIPPSVPLAGNSNSAAMSVKSAAYVSPYTDVVRVGAGLGSSDLWGAPTRPVHNATQPSRTPLLGSTTFGGNLHASGIAFPMQHGTRMSDDAIMHQQAYPSEIDGTGTIRKGQGTFSHRAQSFDVGALAAQAAAVEADSVSAPADADQISLPDVSAMSRPFGAIGSQMSYGAQMSLHGNGTSNSFSSNRNGTLASTGGVVGAHQSHISHQSLPPTHGSKSPHRSKHSIDALSLPSQNQQLLPQQQKQVQIPQSHPQQEHQYHSGSHHLPSQSISRLAPSTLERMPEPETANEVLRSLAQMHFDKTSA